MNERLMLRPSEAGDLMGLSRSKTYELIASGEIPVVRLGRGGCIRVPVEALKEWIARNVTRRDDAING